MNKKIILFAAFIVILAFLVYIAYNSDISNLKEKTLKFMFPKSELNSTLMKSKLYTEHSGITLTTTKTTTTVEFCEAIDKYFDGKYQKFRDGNLICYKDKKSTICAPYKRSNYCP